ncbi:hypothetical protein AB4277_22580 [Vibrio splendidus]
MSLFEKSKELQGKLEEYKENKVLEQRGKQLQPIYNEFSSNHKELNDLVLKLTAFSDNNISINFEGLDDKVTSLNHVMKVIIDSDILGLNQGKDYKRYKKLISELIICLDPILNNTWKSFRSELHSEIPPTAHAILGDNERFLNILKGKKNKLNQLLSRVPRNHEELFYVIKDAQSISSEIDFFIAKLETESPDFMNDFFVEVNKGFDLNKLTPEMLQWLKDNQYISGLIISRTS